MATKFLEPGGDATFGLDLWSNGNIGGGVTPPAIATDFVHGGHLKSIQFNGNSIGASAVMTDAGSRVSIWLYFNVLPAATSTIIINVQTGFSTNIVWRLRMTSAGILQLWNGTAQIGSNGSTLATGQWYRLSFSQVITSTSVNSIKTYVNGVSDITATNVTLSFISGVDFMVGNGSGDGSLDFRGSDFYVDNSTANTDPGNIWVTAKRPLSNGTTNNFAVGGSAGGYGSGNARYVNERPINATDNVSVTPTTVKTEEYTLEGLTVGDIDLTAAQIIDFMGWMSAEVASTANTPVMKIIVAGTGTTKTLTTAAAIYTQIAGSTTYPSTGAAIGMSAQYTTTGHLVTLNECGIVIAYIPPVGPIVQQTSGTASGAPSLTLTPSKNIAAQDLLILFIYGGSGGATVSSVSDGVNTYVLLDSDAHFGTLDGELWYVQSAAAVSSPSIVITFSASDSFVAIFREYGTNSFVLDQHKIGTGNSSSLTSGASSATTGNPDLVVGWGVQVAGSALTIGAGYSDLLTAGLGTTNGALEEKVVNATGAQTATFTGTGTSYVAGVVAFKMNVRGINHLQSLSASFSTAGVLIKQPTKNLTSTFSTSGVLSWLLARILSSNFSTGGVLTKFVALAAFTAVYQTSGVLTSAHQHFQTLTSTFSTSGQIVARSINHHLLATFSTSGSLIAAVSIPLSGSFSSSGILNKQTNRSLGGTFSTSGVLSSIVGFTMALSSTFSTSGQLTQRQLTRLLTATFKTQGNLNKAISRLLSASFTSSGTLSKLTAQTAFTAQFVAQGALTKRPGKGLSSSFSTSGQITQRQVSRLLASTFKTQGALTKQSNRSLSATFSTSGVLTTVHSGGHNQALSSTFSTSGSLQKTPGIALGGTLSTAGNLNKQTNRKLTASFVSSGVLATSRGLFQSLSGTFRTSGSLSRRAGKSFSSTFKTSGVLSGTIKPGPLKNPTPWTPYDPSGPTPYTSVTKEPIVWTPDPHPAPTNFTNTGKEPSQWTQSD